MMKKLSVFMLACILAATGFAARADNISGTVTSSIMSGVDISSDTTDWVYYGNGSMDVKASGPNSLSDLTAKTSTGNALSYSYWSSNNSVLTPITYSNGTPTTSRTNAEGYRYYEGGDSTGNNISFTHTLLGSSETITLYAVAYGSGYKCDFSAALGSGTNYTLSNVTLPTADTGDHYGGICTFTVSGTKGDTLTIKMTSTSSGYSNMGIEAASVTVNSIPEPTSAILLGSALIGLLCYAWRKRK